LAHDKIVKLKLSRFIIDFDRFFFKLELWEKLTSI